MRVGGDTAKVGDCDHDGEMLTTLLGLVGATDGATLGTRLGLRLIFVGRLVGTKGDVGDMLG